MKRDRATGLLTDWILAFLITLHFLRKARHERQEASWKRS